MISTSSSRFRIPHEGVVESTTAHRAQVSKLPPSNDRFRIWIKDHSILQHTESHS